MAAVHIFRNAKDEAGAWENPVTALNFAYTALMGFIALMVGSFFLLYAYTVLMVFLSVKCRANLIRPPLSNKCSICYQEKTGAIT